MIVFGLNNTFRILEYSISNNLFCRMIFPIGLTWYGYLMLCVFVLLLSYILIDVSHAVLKRLPGSHEPKHLQEVHYTSNYNQQYLSQTSLWDFLKKNKLKYGFVYALIVLFMVVSYANVIAM